MKVGLITLYGYINFGNRLQNYAISHVLKSRFDCEVDTLVSVKEKAFYNGDYRAWLKERLAKMFCVIPSFAEKRWGSDITRWNNFYNWSHRYIPTKFFYEHPSLPESLNQKYDVFFVGSDQIWNYRFPDMNYDNYFLSFADNKKRAAICGSFGIESIPTELKQRYAEGLSGFEHISVREKAGAKLIEDLIGWDVPVLVDPVMLLDREEWIKVAKKPRVDISKPYVLKYYLGNEATDDQVDVWAKENGYVVYELLDKKNTDLYSAGPGEFISLIANAALVASDSFHCIAFSTIFKRPFLVYTRGTMNSRLDTLLETFAFQNRWGNLLSPNDYLTCDHTHTDEIMRVEQERAFNYIKNVLNSK